MRPSEWQLRRSPMSAANRHSAAALLGLFLHATLSEAVPWRGSASVPSKTPMSAPAPRPELSSYEQSVLEQVLTERGLRLETHPEGKLVDRLEIVTLEVFTPESTLGSWLNWAHTTSRREIVDREILLRPGQPFQARLLEESSRNLRSLRQLSLVLLVPITSDTPDRVTILAVTKDVWSLRLNSQWRVKNGRVEHLVLQPSEENLAGTHLRVATQYVYDVSTHALGVTLSTSRLSGSRIAALGSVHGIVEQRSGRLEGSTGALSYGQPLYSADSIWGFGTNLVWENRMTRLLLPDSQGRYVFRTYDDPGTPIDEALPYEYRGRELVWQNSVTRSFGRETKLDVSTGLEATLRRYSADGLVTRGYSRGSVDAFEEQELPRSDSRIGPFVTIDLFQHSFVSLLDVETLGLQEDFRIGPRVFVKMYGGSTHAQSSRDMLGLSLGADYTASLAGSLHRIWAVHTAEFARGPFDDRLLQFGVHLVSPPLRVGRLVMDAGAALRYRDYYNHLYALGGDTRLRGYPSARFIGTSILTSNLEFRTRSVDVLGMLFGLVGFYDAGDTFDWGTAPRPKQSLGFGGRSTIPQLQRIVGRLDVSFPLTPAPRRDPVGWPAIDVVLSLSGQAFPWPSPQPSTLATPLLPATQL